MLGVYLSIGFLDLKTVLEYRLGLQLIKVKRSELFACRLVLTLMLFVVDRNETEQRRDYSAVLPVGDQ